MVPRGGEIHLDLVEVGKLRLPRVVQCGDVAVACFEKPAEAGLVERGFRPAVSGVDELERPTVDLRPNLRLGEIAQPLVDVAALGDVARELPHCEVRAVLVVRHPDIVAVPAERLGRLDHHGLAHPAVVGLPVGRPVVHEVVGHSPLGGLPKRAAIVAERSGVVVAVQRRVVDAAEPASQLSFVVPGVPVKEDVADPRAVQGRRRRGDGNQQKRHNENAELGFHHLSLRTRLLWAVLVATTHPSHASGSAVYGKSI